LVARDRGQLGRSRDVDAFLVSKRFAAESNIRNDGCSDANFGPSADMFVEFVGDYDHQRPGQILNVGGAWRFTKTQQLDFHAGFGLNSSSVDHYFGMGYSIRFDRLFGVTVAKCTMTL
jgi:hypothetical protein